jgi:hypothetical protein
MNMLRHEHEPVHAKPITHAHVLDGGNGCATNLRMDQVLVTVITGEGDEVAGIGFADVSGPEAWLQSIEVGGMCL